MAGWKKTAGPPRPAGKNFPVGLSEAGPGVTPPREEPVDNPHRWHNGDDVTAIEAVGGKLNRMVAGMLGRGFGGDCLGCDASHARAQDACGQA